MHPTTRLHRTAGLIVVGVALTACGATSTTPASAPTPPAAQTSTAAEATQLDPPEFAAAVADERTFVVNVHVPDEGSIAGTDAAIPYDRIGARSAELPEDRSAPLAVYCKSGRMSAEAAATLQELGYTDLVELRGGMDAWVADGRELLPAAG